MDGPTILVGLAGVLATAAPIVVAAIGETFAERSGVINLSVNGSILLSAMGSFAVAVTTGSLVLGFITGAAIGAAVALIVAFGSITLRQSQVAIGFVLTLFCRDLAYFLGNPFMGEKGPRLAVHPIPGLEKIPILGTLLFEHDIMTYFSFVLIVVAWWWIFRTRPGLTLRAVGERPAAAFARGAQVNALRYIYTILGGALVGLAGPMYSLSVKAGWKGTISGLDGLGWIVLAIVIFGAWNPVRVALGAYLFGLLAVAQRGPAAQHPGHPLPGAPGRPVPADDPHPPAGEHRQRRVGGAGARLAAGAMAQARRPRSSVVTRGAAPEPGRAF